MPPKSPLPLWCYLHLKGRSNGHGRIQLSSPRLLNSKLPSLGQNRQVAKMARPQHIASEMTPTSEKDRDARTEVILVDPFGVAVEWDDVSKLVE